MLYKSKVTDDHNTWYGSASKSTAQAFEKQLYINRFIKIVVTIVLTFVEVGVILAVAFGISCIRRGI